MNNNQKNSSFSNNEMPKELQDFNWAAFFLTFIWGTKFKAPITFLAIPLILIQLPLGLNWLLLAGLQLYCGIKGNEWAYKQESWKKSKDFRITQMKWAAVAVGSWIIVPLILLTISARFLKNTYNLPELIQNAQCISAYKIAKKDIKYTDITSTTSNYEIINQIAKRYNISTTNEASIQVTNKKNNKLTQAYSILASKNHGEICSFGSENCQLQYTFHLEHYYKYPNDCVFYFNNGKRLQPDNKTQRAIKKGFNLFKYL